MEACPSPVSFTQIIINYRTDPFMTPLLTPLDPFTDPFMTPFWSKWSGSIFFDPLAFSPRSNSLLSVVN